MPDFYFKAPETYTFKQFNDLNLQVDVYLPQQNKDVPVVVYFHGGALMMGNRRLDINSSFGHVVKSGAALVSVEYRLAPEAKITDIHQDCLDACNWIREEGPGLFGADPERLAVAGGSAGGYLALSMGMLLKPRFRAVFSLWGYGDIMGDWYSQSDEFYRNEKPLVSEDEAIQGIVSEPLAGLWDNDLQNKRAQLYLYYRQNGLWTEKVAGADPKTDPQALYPLCPERNVDENYPPTYLIHGENDTDVPCRLSEQMAEVFVANGVEHVLKTFPGCGHGLGEMDEQTQKQEYQKGLDFVLGKLE